MRQVLSPFSFYGGKSRMAPFICELLDYAHTQLYIEPFGGACRVLLNKPRHQVEIYNDFGYGLSNFFETLSAPELAERVISILADIIPDEDIFYEMLQYKLEHEGELIETMQKQFRKFVWGFSKKYDCEDLKTLYSLIGKREYQQIIDIAEGIVRDGVLQDDRDARLMDCYLSLFTQYWSIVKEQYDSAYNEAKEAFADALNERAGDIKIRNIEKKKHQFCHEQALESIEDFTSDTLTSNISAFDKDPVQMAVATFITYYLSRDGMGREYSPEMNKSYDRYYRHVLNLEDVAERMEGVTVTQLDALLLIKHYCNHENVMMYLDPSYLNMDKENDSEKKNRKKDLGKGIYNRSFSVEEHEKLAAMIQNAKAHIILSNYDTYPYNQYLDEEHGWKKQCFDTRTSVGNKAGNERVEVLWYNY